MDHKKAFKPCDLVIYGALGDLSRRKLLISLYSLENANFIEAKTRIIGVDLQGLKNPNRVRSLIGAFSQANPLHFHAANGQGYQFLADQIIALNTLNPQVASRMLSALTSWRRYDTGRQALIKAELERIIATEDVSKDVYEVASKSLA